MFQDASVKGILMRRCILIGLCTLRIWLMADEGGAQTVIRSTGYLVMFLPNNGRTAALSADGDEALATYAGPGSGCEYRD